MQSDRTKKLIVLLLKLLAIGGCFTFIVEHYFFEISPYTVSSAFILSFVALIALGWYTRDFQRKDYFRPLHILLIVVLLF